MSVFHRVFSRRVITRAPGVLAELIGGPVLNGVDCQLFEQEFSERLGRTHAVALCSGRAALVAILEDLGLKPGDEVVFPAYTMESLPELVRNKQWIPRFSDVDPQSFNMTAKLIEPVLTSRTRAVVATHLFGTACDIEPIKELCEARNIVLLEDCAHALDATLGGQSVGTFGRAAFYSFEIAKQINTFGGTVVVSDDDELMTGLRMRVKETALSAADARRLATKVVSTYAEHLVTQSPAYKALVMSKLDDGESGNGLIERYKQLKANVRAASLAWTSYQARLGLRQLRALEGTLGARRRVSEQMISGLNDLMEFQAVLPGADHTYYMCVARVENASQVAQQLRDVGIDCGHGEQLMQHCPQQDPEEQHRQFPGTNEAIRTALQLPLHPDMAENHVEELIAKIRSVLSS